MTDIDQYTGVVWICRNIADFVGCRCKDALDGCTARLGDLSEFGYASRYFIQFPRLLT